MAIGYNHRSAVDHFEHREQKRKSNFAKLLLALVILAILYFLL